MSEWWTEIVDAGWRFWLYLSSGRVMAIVFGVAFAVLAIGLFIASKTKWGRAKPLTKFVVLSVVLHVWLLIYAVGSVPVLPQGDPNGVDRGVDDAIAISLSPDLFEASEAPVTEPEPWEQASPSMDYPEPETLAGVNLDDLEPEPLPELAPDPRSLPELPPLETTPPPMPDLPDLPTLRSDTQPTEPRNESVDAVEVPVPEAESRPTPAAPVQDVARQLPVSDLPEAYQLRQAPDRLERARAYGADADTEAAVAAALKWLAGTQSQDGSWNAAAYGAGTETNALGLSRSGTGRDADTGVTGLALLAFLAAGHTHLEGEYAATVRNGLIYLLNAQMPSGDLSGPKQLGNSSAVLNSRMYCHSIAMLAVAEAHAMTKDKTLREAVIQAANYSLGAQDPRGGGWRYRPREPGDLSQFGWQAMALKSVERSGLAIPAVVQARMRRFLNSCSAGNFGGLARYKPGEGRPSETMTAESLACRFILDYPLSSNGLLEAKKMVMNSRPGVGEDNVYFWYYATLALYQLQDDDWRVWNQAMKQRLLATQIPAYEQQAGSWKPDKLWGGYGGRVYSTAMSCLCLEVYYRYLPMYQRSNLAQGGLGVPVLNR